MSFGILRRFLNLAASNSKSIQIRRFLNTAASDPKPLHNGKGKRKGGSQLRDAVSVQDPSRRPKILMSISVVGLFLVHEAISKADAEELRREFRKNLPEVEDYETKKEACLKRIEEVKLNEEEAKEEHKLLLQELEELQREKSYPNI